MGSMGSILDAIKKEDKEVEPVSMGTSGDEAEEEEDDDTKTVKANNDDDE